MNDVELPLGSTVFRLDTDDVTTSSVFATVVAEIMAGIDRSGGLVLTLRPVPGDAAVPLGALARSAAALLHLLDGPGVARAVRACRELGVRAVVVERVELLDGHSAAVIHHLVDVGAALLVCTVSRGAVLPEPIVGLVVSDRLAVADLADQVNITCDRAADDLEGRASVKGSSVGNLTAREREIAEFVVDQQVFTPVGRHQLGADRQGVEDPEERRGVLGLQPPLAQSDWNHGCTPIHTDGGPTSHLCESVCIRG